MSMIQFENAVKRYGEIILNDLKESGIVCWIAGGALRDYFMGIPIKTDHDLFFPSESEFDKCAVWFKAKEAAIKWESDNGMKVVYKGRTFDLIKHYFSGPQTTIEAFDFTVSMFAVDTEKIYHGETSFIDLSKRQLMIHKLSHPASTMSRAFRYYKKGFSMCQGEMRKLVEAIQDMPKPEPQPDGSEETTNEPPSGNDNTDFFRGID